jgi:hypothetical protein
MLSASGAARVYAYDLKRIATVEQVNAIIAQLQRVLPGEWPQISKLDDLSARYRIEYCAPADARATRLPARSVDFVCSTSTLEHVPCIEIRAILAECGRIASDHALLSFIVDYHDHYRSADPSITHFNFYRFSEAEWVHFNPPGQYQNRMRHCDYLRIFAECGFEIIEGRRVTPPWAAEELARTAVCHTFRAYTVEDLMTTSGFFLMRSAVPLIDTIGK